MSKKQQESNSFLLYEEVLWLIPFTLVNLWLYTDVAHWLYSEFKPELALAIYDAVGSLEIIFESVIAGLISAVPLGLIFGSLFRRRLLLYGLIIFIPPITVAIYAGNGLFMLLGVLGEFCLFFVAALVSQKFIKFNSPLHSEVSSNPKGIRKALYIAGTLGATTGICALIVITRNLINGMSYASVDVIVVIISLFIIGAIAYVHGKAV